MKQIFIALICTVIGFNASANNLEIKKEVHFTFVDAAAKIKNHDIKVAYIGNLQAGLLRREKVFRFTDACGVKWDIHVFAPNNTSNWAMWVEASSFFEQGTWGNDGCYHNQP